MEENRKKWGGLRAKTMFESRVIVFQKQKRNESWFLLLLGSLARDLISNSIIMPLARKLVKHVVLWPIKNHFCPPDRFRHNFGSFEFEPVPNILDFVLSTQLEMLYVTALEHLALELRHFFRENAERACVVTPLPD